MTPGVVQHCGNMWSTVGASKVTEDLFQRYRWLETKSCHQHPPLSSFWEHGISKEVLHKVYRFDPLPMQPLCASEAKVSALPKAMYRPSPKAASVDFRGIVGQATPPWFTCTSTSAALPYCDLILARYCEAHGVWDSIGSAWLSILFRGGKQLVKHPTTDGWCFCLGDVSGLIGLGWPAVEVGQFFAPKLPLCSDELEYLVCVNFKEWQSMTFKWCCPLELAKQSGNASGMANRLLAKATSRPQALLKTAAEHCFFDLPLVPLRQLAKFVGCELAQGCDRPWGSALSSSPCIAAGHRSRARVARTSSWGWALKARILTRIYASCLESGVGDHSGSGVPRPMWSGLARWQDNFRLIPNARLRA